LQQKQKKENEQINLFPKNPQRYYVLQLFNISHNPIKFPWDKIITSLLISPSVKKKTRISKIIHLQTKNTIPKFLLITGQTVKPAEPHFSWVVRTTLKSHAISQGKHPTENLMWSFVYQNISIIKLPLAIVRILIG
jgi:hypothetical protein